MEAQYTYPDINSKQKHSTSSETSLELIQSCVSQMSRNCRAKQVSIRSTMVSALIIILCITDGQVQSFKKRNLRYDDNGLTTMASDENEIINNTSSFQFGVQFGVNTRGWQIFDSWKINEPHASSYGKITYKVNIGNRKRQHLLVSGATPLILHFINKPGRFSNWLYTVDANSWQTVDNGDFPPLGSSPVMIQLCSKIIAFETDLIFGNSNSRKAWTFDTILLHWENVQVHGLPSIWFHFRGIIKWREDVAAVAVFQSATNCQCHQSAIVMLRLSDFRKAMYEVRCVSREGTERYKWIYINFSPGEMPRFPDMLVASSYLSTIVLYVPAEKTLWKFENRKWTHEMTLPYRFQSFHNTSQSNSFGCALATNNSRFIVFSILDKKVLNFDLKRKAIIMEDVAGDIPDKRYKVMSNTVEDQNTVIVFTVDLRSERTRVWKFIYEKKVWTWKRLPSPDLIPAFGEVSTYALKENDFTFAPVFIKGIDQGLWGAVVWNLDLTSMQWWKRQVSNSIPDHYDNLYKASCLIGKCCFVALSSHINERTMKAWIYNSTENKVRLLISTSSIKVTSSMSFVSVNSTTAILFAGRKVNNDTAAVFNETWIIQLQPMFQLRQAIGETLYSVRPSARFDHAAVIMQSKMYVFGGIDASDDCLNDLWMFDVNTQIWSEQKADNRGPNVTNAWTCEYSAAATPGQLLITVKYNYRYESTGYERYGLETWIYIVHVKRWHLIAPFELNEYSVKLMAGILSKTIYWRGFLVMFDIFQRDINYLAVRCPAGFTSADISKQPCHFCRKGYYRETTFSDQDCVPCPSGLTTISLGARSIEQCNLCNVDSCKYGKCVPDFSEKNLRPACQCYVGFTGSTCQYPTYLLIGAGIILFVAVASAGVTAYLLVLNRRKESERALRNEVQLLTNVWQIDEDEVMSEELLGSGASGSVYKAFYRNITVAVKKMVAVGFPKSIEDFEMEIMFMRTVRHKNIVLFIGAGKSQPGDVPFLVMEYMERGSLRNVLYDLSIDIDYDRKLSFAIDSARGMHFLHTLEPHRIHRDLKSDNLLVSKDWIVKVADFGLGRAVTGNVKENYKQQIRRHNRLGPQHISLLPKREGLSFAGVGTARWRAPELNLREPYDIAVDVYRYYSLIN